MALGVVTVSTPLAYVTSVCSAARTSRSLFGSRGRASTTVSRRSPAVNWMEPASTFAVTEIGSGVSKEGMAVPSSWVFRTSPLVGRGVDEVKRGGGAG